MWYWVCAKLELKILKVGRFSIGWFIAVMKQQESAVFGCWSDVPRHTCGKKESSFWWVGNQISLIFPSVLSSIQEHTFLVQLSTTLYSLQLCREKFLAGWHNKGPQTLAGPLCCRVCRGGCYATSGVLNTSKKYFGVVGFQFLPRCMECNAVLTMRFLSVCPSVRLSVKRVHCDKTEESYV